jgi:hypothetical protein
MVMEGTTMAAFNDYVNEYKLGYLRKGKGVTMADMQKHRVYKLNLNKFGRVMLCLASAIGMTYIWVEILLGLAGM